MKNYIIFGPPCSGKGTMCKLLAERYGFNHKSTGDMIRSHQERRTRLGLIADKVGVSKGNFLPDIYVSEMIKEDYIAEQELNKVNGLLLDGYPRNIAQAKDIMSFLNNRKERITAVIYFDLDEATLIKRMQHRSKIEGRPDDNLETFMARLRKYRAETEPVLEYLQNKAEVIRVDASGTMDEQFGRLIKSIDLEVNFSSIVAAGLDEAIGKGNDLLWHLPNDFKWFKEKTGGKAIIMGRKTYESLNRMSLPNRHIFIMTNRRDYANVLAAIDADPNRKGNRHDVTLCSSLGEAMRKSIEWSRKNFQNEVVVCGGTNVYKQFLDAGVLQKVYKTTVQASFPEADSKFFDLEPYGFERTFHEYHQLDEKHQYDYSFNVWENN